MKRIIATLLLISSIFYVAIACITGGSTDPIFVEPGTSILFASEDSPDNYPYGDDCTNTFISAPGSTFSVTCKYIMPELCDDVCPFDSISIPGVQEPTCGQGGFSVIIESNTFEFVFERPETAAQYDCLEGTRLFKCIVTASKPCDCEATKINKRIVFGDDASPNEYPYMALLKTRNAGQKGFNFACGASIISKRCLLTAAHCIDGSVEEVEVTLGEHSPNIVESTEQIFKTTNIFPHPDFTFSQSLIANDIGIIVLNEDIKFNDAVSPVCLPNFDTPTNTTVIATGWGRDENIITPTNVLQELKATMFTQTDCNNQSPLNIFQTDNICIVVADKTICFGDSGGPITATTIDDVLRQFGVTSFVFTDSTNPTFCHLNRPMGYTEVYEHIDWIKKTCKDEICIPSNCGERKCDPESLNLHY